MLNEPTRLGHGFILKHVDINPTHRSGICDACGEDIDVTDGSKYVKMQIRTEGFLLSFHEDCFEYIFTGILKFYQTFLEHRHETSIQN
jgi:hypothetical protein